MLQRVAGAVREGLTRQLAVALSSLELHAATELSVDGVRSLRHVATRARARTRTRTRSTVETIPPPRWRQLGWLGWPSGARGISAPSVDTGDANDASESPLHVSDALPYKLSVVTGDVRGAGSSTPVAVTLYGDDDESSESHVIGGEESQAFERATKSQYVLYSKSLGRLKRIVIEQLPGKRGRSASDTAWYLDRIEVNCPDGHRYAFPCSSWFGKDSKKKNLMVADEHKDTQRSSLHDPSPTDRLTQPLQVSASGFAIPHPSKVRSGIKGVNKKGVGHGGEDSYFYATNSNGSYAVGVADGVYEWKLSGIDAGIFSRQLVEFCRQAVELGTMDALSVLQFASKHLKRSGTLGSSVVSLGIVDLIQGRLQTATIGDSGFVLLGRTKEDGGSHVIRYRSPQQEHSFGCPYQLGHQEGADVPEDAMLATVPVYPGDVLVFGSDGLFDNVSDERIVEIVDDVLAGGGTSQEICHALASSAFAASTDKSALTPYSTAASQAFEMVFTGMFLCGRLICVLVVVRSLVRACLSTRCVTRSLVTPSSSLSTNDQEANVTISASL